MFDPILDTMTQTLAARHLRHNVVTGNIANADTPGYRAKRVDFEDALLSRLATNPGMAVSRTHSGHLDGQGDGTSLGRISQSTPGAESGPDGNDVSRDQEMAKLSQNQILYRASASVVSRNLALTRYAIVEGGR